MIKMEFVYIVGGVIEIKHIIKVEQNHINTL